MYIIWSNEHRAWWRPNSRGYTPNISDAGVYSREDAMDIVEGANKYQEAREAPNELAVPIADLSSNLIMGLGVDIDDLEPTR